MEDDAVLVFNLCKILACPPSKLDSLTDEDWEFFRRHVKPGEFL